MPRYYVNGVEVSGKEAKRKWQSSRTYQLARLADAVFGKAERGDFSGGVAEHLAEAGIRIEPIRLTKRKPKESTHD